MVIPIAAVGAGLIDLAIAFLILFCLLIYYGIGVSISLLMLPLLVALLALLALAVGMWMAALNIKYRDVRYALPFLIQVWMFASPIIYPTSIVPAKWRWALALNPLTGIIESFRASLQGFSSFNWSLLAISMMMTLMLLLFSAYSFRRMEKSFADIV